MKFIIKYSDAYSYLWRSPNDIIRIVQEKYPDIKIDIISNDTLSITYPQTLGLGLNQILPEFRRYGYVDDFIPYYLLTVANTENLSKIVDSLNDDGINVTFKTPFSLILENSDLTFDFLYELIEYYIRNNFILVPYEPKEDNYIKVKHDFSSIYQSDLLADMEFHVSGKIFKAHKAIILGMSDYLHSFIIKYSQTQEINVIEFVEDPDLFKLMLDLIYGIPVKIDGLKTLELIKLIQYFQVRGVDIDDIIKQIEINKETESDLYVKSLSEIYLNDVPNELLEIIRNQINLGTNISSLSKQSI